MIVAVELEFVNLYLLLYQKINTVNHFFLRK
jgi:hypothetical protein